MLIKVEVPDSQADAFLSEMEVRALPVYASQATKLNSGWTDEDQAIVDEIQRRRDAGASQDTITLKQFAAKHARQGV